jgi:monofunctional biosynthetic peptidoglycan transglycosylase
MLIPPRALTREPAPIPGEPAPDERDAQSFTSAAETLFRPPSAAAVEPPHLITLGRRLDPSLHVQRPTAPTIAPRAEPEPTPPTQPTWADGTWKDRLRISARYAAYAAGGYLALVLVLIVLFRFIDPPGSMLMLSKLLRGNAIDRTWVPLEAISPALIRAVIVSEDDRFCDHFGIDPIAMKQAIEQAGDGAPRGASTISMQVIKNLFLWSSKSYVRKVIEIPLTLTMELLWPKRRILEVYLNIAEWGPGIFGAEAAARRHFNKPASRLNEGEAALLAATLPNPVVRIAGSPGPQTSRKARVVQSRVKAYGSVASCIVEPAKAVATPQTVRRPALRTAPRRKKVDDWPTTLQFGN